MNTITAFATVAGACVFAAVTVAQPALAGKGVAPNDPARDGQQVILLDGPAGEQEILLPDTSDSAEFAKLAGNGPSLDGRQVILLDGAVGEQEIVPPDTSDNTELAKLAGNGPSLDGQRAVLPVGPQLR